MGCRKTQTGVRQASLRSNSGRIQKQDPRGAVRRSQRLRETRSRLAFEGVGPQQGSLPPPPKTSQRKRKRPQETEAPPASDSTTERRKRARIRVDTPSSHGDPQRERASAANEDEHPVAYWCRYGHWPAGYSKSNDDDMNHLLARKKSETSLSRKSSDAGGWAGLSYVTPSDEKPRELKSAPYRHPGYKVFLGTRGSFMEDSDGGITTKSSQDYCKLLTGEAEVPRDSLFRDDIFKKACRNIQSRNEAKVILDITRLLVPSAESLAVYGATELQRLTESINEGWNNSIPVTKTRPQPDYAVGFRREAFTEDQLKKMEPFFGGLFDVSYFMATYYLYLPFLTCEVKCGASALDIADCQNAHSMTIAVRGIVELFRLANREQELHREIVAFSISHDYRSVRIYGHYAVIEGKTQKYYRHAIRTFDFTELDGKEKWTAYKFTRNIYEKWMPKHFESICSVIDQLPPDVSFEVSQRSELQFTDKSGLSQDLQASRLARSSASSQPSPGPVDSQSSVVAAQNVTPNTSVNEAGSAKGPKRKRGRKATRTPSPTPRLSQTNRN